MSRASLAFTLPLVGAALLVTVAHADSAQDGNAGLDALNHGSYHEAIRLFTRALKAGDLGTDDKEFAYLNRGKAYLAEGKKTLAIADLKKAASLNPNDADVQAALRQASGVAAATPPAPPPVPVDPDAAWGSILGLIDHYWVEQDPDPDAWSICHWKIPHIVMTCEGLAKNGKRYAATYELDPATSKITYTQGGDVAPYTAPVEVHEKSYALDIESSGKYIQETYTPTSDTTIQVTIALYDGNTWKTLKTAQLVQQSAEVVQAYNWRAGKDKTHSFWKDLGQSLAAGAAAGIVQGLQPQPQQ